VGRRRFAGPLSIALGALAVACSPASAQLPDLTGPMKLPTEDGGVGELLPGETVERVVGDVVNEPLPEPVEQIVQDSPVAPVRDDVRGVVNEALGTGGAGGDGGSTGSGSGSGSGADGSSSGAGSEAGAGTGGIPGSGTGGAPRSTRERSDRGTGGGPRRPRGVRPLESRPLKGSDPLSGRGLDLARPGPSAGAPDRRRRQRDGREASGERRSAVVRTIETVVRAVPTPIWIALGMLSLLALALGARTFVEQRRARVLARERERLVEEVAVLERALLPAVPERVGALSTSVAFRSSDGPAAGGDFYDAFELQDGRAAVLVGDVSGHGADALEATNSVRSQLHALLDAGLGPREAIAMVGERTPPQLAGRFTTVVVAVHDPAAGTLTYATAGHAPPIILGSAADELLSAGASPPIGVGIRTGLRETTVALPSGSVACLYTDGLVEAKAGDAMLGRARLEALVESLEPDDDALTLLQRVVAEADEAADDMTACLLRPVSAADALTPRVEILELAVDDLESGLARRFLDACGVRGGEQALALQQAGTIVDSDAGALLEVIIADGVGRVRVSPVGAAAPWATA
jgi:hypothetical protein